MQKLINTFNIRFYILFLGILQIILIYLSYTKLFNYQGCTNNVIRDIGTSNFNYGLLYPEMCDEPFYFHGFQWINHIYENGFPYQDRPLYLALGFIIYRTLFITNLFLGLNVSILSLLLITSLIIQVTTANLISFFLTKYVVGKFNKFYFLVFLVLTYLSFEFRIHLFLPSSATIYLLVYIFSLNSIKMNSLNGLYYGLLFTISGFSIIGFSFQVLIKIIKKENNLKYFIKNISYFIIPFLSFEIVRMLIGLMQGKEYGVRYVHAVTDYQQFIWFFKSVFTSNYEPINVCHQLSEFVTCYLSATRVFFSLNIFYILLVLVLVLFYSIMYKKIQFNIFYSLTGFTFYSYLFISIQGMYDYRFVYYSLGFFTIVLTATFIYRINDDFITFLFLTLFGSYTLSRIDYIDFNLNLTLTENFLVSFLVFTMSYKIFVNSKK